jgi:hypothetical protein
MGRVILVCGGRDFGNVASAKTDKERLQAIEQVKFVWAELDRLDSEERIEGVVHGAAKGADRAAARWASVRFRRVFSHPAEWHDLAHPEAIVKEDRWGRKYNANAGPARNTVMLDLHPDIELVVAFPGGTGTADMVKKAKGRELDVVEYDWG